MEGVEDMTTSAEIAAGRKLPVSQGGSLPESVEPTEPTSEGTGEGGEGSKQPGEGSSEPES